MRRVLRYLEWQAGWWRERLAPRPDASLGVAAGIRAYALKQADLHKRIGNFFENKWTMPVGEAARKMVAFEAAAQQERPLALDEFFAVSD